MLCTTLIDHVSIGAADGKILEKLHAQVTEIHTVRQQRMVIGIRNHEGAIYRVIGVTGLPDFLEVIGKLTGLNMTDELEEASGPRQGYNAIFKPE